MRVAIFSALFALLALFTAPVFAARSLKQEIIIVNPDGTVADTPPAVEAVFVEQAFRPIDASNIAPKPLIYGVPLLDAALEQALGK